MTPGIYYFYEYQTDKKIRTVGFLKLTQTFPDCQIQISIRQIPVTSQEKLPLSMLIFQHGRIYKKTVADLPSKNQCISCRVKLSAEDFPPDLTCTDLYGFLVETPGGKYFIAGTDTQPFSTALLTDWTTSVPLLETEPAPSQPDPVIEPEPEEETPSVLAEETSYVSSPCPCIRKLCYEELSSLQKPFWRLANNSFLLHGCHNYHHLLLLEEEGHQWLGVPGIYSPREARAAELFGFPQFTKDYHKQLNLSEEECSPDKDFGYWCRCLK